MSAFPHPSGAWNPEAMPWTRTVVPFGGVMEFNAELALDRKLPNNGHKRKSNEFAPIPSKKFITEEKMAAHMKGLHISSDFVSHSGSGSDDLKNATTEVNMDDDTDFGLPMTQKELEEKLRRASRIIVCDELKKLNEGDPIIPKALLSRFEKPCTALVLWQPPPKLSGFNDKQELCVRPDSELVEDDDNDNNNCSNLDLNYTMETDM